MASYKQKPKNLAPIWSSSMKAGSCWFRALPGPGPRAGRRRFCAVPADSPRFRLFPVSASLPKGSGLCFIPSFTATKTSNPHWWEGSLPNCSNICGGMCSFFGMEAGATREQWLGSFLKNIRNFILNDLFCQVISKRAETGSMIITTSKAFKDWTEVFQDNAVATAIAERLIEHGELIKIEGSSYRVKKRKKRQLGM